MRLLVLVWESKSVFASCTTWNSLKNSKDRPGVVVHTCNPSTREAEAGLQVKGLSGLQSEFKEYLDYIMRL